MTKRIGLAAALMFVLTVPAMAQRDRGDRSHPGALARRCIATMERLANRAVDHTSRRTHRCIRSINVLLEEGAEDAAHEVARRCTDSVNTTAERVAGRIHHLAARCIERLMELGASEEMIAAVRRAAGRSVERVQSAAERSANAIRALFDE